MTIVWTPETKSIDEVTWANILTTWASETHTWESIAFWQTQDKS